LIQEADNSDVTIDIALLDYTASDDNRNAIDDLREGLHTARKDKNQSGNDTSRGCLHQNVCPIEKKN
jgi:hypothetical protein